MLWGVVFLLGIGLFHLKAIDRQLGQMARRDADQSRRKAIASDPQGFMTVDEIRDHLRAYYGLPAKDQTQSQFHPGQPVIARQEMEMGSTRHSDEEST